MSNETPNHEQVIFATLAPMASLAARFGTSMKRLRHLTELAYYQETKRQGLRMKDIQRVMSVGFAKVGVLSRQLKEYHAENSDDADLQRRIMLLLWALPFSRSQIGTAFADIDEDLLTKTLDRMVEDGQLTVEPGPTPRYRLVPTHYSMVSDGFWRRVSALESLMSCTAQTIENRFFSGGRPAFARTLSFRVRESDLERLDKFYREQLIPLIDELDEDAKDGDATVPVRLSYLWTHDKERGES